MFLAVTDEPVPSTSDGAASSKRSRRRPSPPPEAASEAAGYADLPCRMLEWGVECWLCADKVGGFLPPQPISPSESLFLSLRLPSPYLFPPSSLSICLAPPPPPHLPPSHSLFVSLRSLCLSVDSLSLFLALSSYSLSVPPAPHTLSLSPFSFPQPSEWSQECPPPVQNLRAVIRFCSPVSSLASLLSPGWCLFRDYLVYGMLFSLKLFLVCFCFLFFNAAFLIISFLPCFCFQQRQRQQWRWKQGHGWWGELFDICFCFVNLTYIFFLFLFYVKKSINLVSINQMEWSTIPSLKHLGLFFPVQILSGSKRRAI